ncbi:cytokine-like protein 1 [Chanos chanos]|uniref:Cytokine-like protein 1 n=1 Tax=Chanos chanos TaxID=29144 RepID=A0A6J2UQ32_CHACN|nr:cytokine-like protein 1 [Chanos chanos]
MRPRYLSLVFFFSFVWLANCAPPTCYSRVLGLGKEIMEILDKVHKYQRTKTCAEILPPLFLDVHNSCLTAKLRDLLYILENHPTENCRERPRIIQLKRKARSLYVIINRVCYRDLVFFTNDCEALETGHSSPRYGEDRLQLLEER